MSDIQRFYSLVFVYLWDLKTVLIDSPPNLTTSIPYCCTPFLNWWKWFHYCSVIHTYQNMHLKFVCMITNSVLNVRVHYPQMTECGHFYVMCLHFLSELYFLLWVCRSTSLTHFSRFSQGSAKRCDIHTPKSCGVINDPNKKVVSYTLVMTFFLKNQLLISNWD